MSTTTTTTPVRLVETFEGTGGTPEGGNNFRVGTNNRLYQTLDGYHYVVSSWGNTEVQFGPHAMAWEAEDENGQPTNDYKIRLFLATDPVATFSVKGEDTDETHNAALAQQGYHIAQEVAA